MNFRKTMRLLAPLLLAWIGAGCSDDPAEPDAGVQRPDAAEQAFCPSRLRMAVVSGGVVHVGWTGVTHNNRLPLDAEFVMAITACDSSCRSCSFEGPIPDPAINLHRCITDTSLPCSSAAECPPFQCVPTSPTTLGCANTGAPCTRNADCDPGECSTFLGANSASPIRPNCFAAMFRAAPGQIPVTGRVDLATGLLTFERFGLWIVSSDPNVNPGFCPVCEGDTVRGDGVKGGTCVENPHGSTMGATLGNACDAHSNSGIPIRAGVYSLDCAVPMGPSFDFSTYGAGTAAARRWTLTAGEQPTCGDGPCWCGLCEGTMSACHEADDCAPGVACVAAAQAGVPGPFSSRCVDVCAWDNETLTGQCDAVVGATDAGAPVLGKVPCLPRGDTAEVVVRGSSERLGPRAYSMVIASVGCAGPSFSPAVSGALGLPGPNVSVYRLRVDLE